jgi:hypothetical protein
MPKKSMESATYYGHEGLVVDANDKVHEVDPSRNLDGSVVDGYESDERTLEDRPGSEQPGVPLRGLPDAPTTVTFDNSDLTGDNAKAAPSGAGPDGEPIVGSMSNTPEENANLAERLANGEELTADTDASQAPQSQDDSGSSDSAPAKAAPVKKAAPARATTTSK